MIACWIDFFDILQKRSPEFSCKNAVQKILQNLEENRGILITIICVRGVLLVSP